MFAALLMLSYVGLTTCLFMEKSSVPDLFMENSESSNAHIFSFKLNSKESSATLGCIQQIISIFEPDNNVLIQIKNDETFEGDSFECSYSSPVPSDRTCLVPPPYSPKRSVESCILTERGSCSSILFYVNEKSNNFRDVTGGLDIVGDFVEKQLQNLYRVGSFSQASEGSSQREIESCRRIDVSNITRDDFINDYWLHQQPVILMGFPEWISARSRIRSKLDQAEQKSNPSFLSLLYPYLEDEISMKLSPNEEFEGIDSLLNWGMAREQRVPPDVLNQMESPELVVVRAVHQEGKLKDALQLIAAQQDAGTEQASNNCSVNAYIEYLNLNSRLPGLLATLLGDSSYSPTEALFKAGNTNPNDSKNPRGQSSDLGPFMRQGAPYLWLGSGHTVGKLHFDPFDNFMFQFEGSKTFRVTDTESNEKMREGHMREAQLGIVHPTESSKLARNGYKGSYFVKHELSESTSMVHSPIQLDLIAKYSTKHTEHNNTENVDGLSSAANMAKSLHAKDVKWMDCEVRAGEVLYLPSYWWHEVSSSPGHTHFDPVLQKDVAINLAVNYWFDPLYKKDFPCSTCRKYINRDYRELLWSLLKV